MRRIAFITIVSFIFVLGFSAAASALDEKAPSLGFLPANAPLVMAFDMDEIMTYAHSVGDTWREVDRTHFMDALGELTMMMPKDVGGPDMMLFLQALGGVQTIAMDPVNKSNGLLIFTGRSTTQREILLNHAVAVLVGSEYRSNINKINNALMEYYYRTLTDPETKEETQPYNYPESLDVLIEQGYLDTIPMNPFTGRKMKIVPFDTVESLGNVAYQPVADYNEYPQVAPVESESDVIVQPTTYSGYTLKAWQIDGVLTIGPYSRKYFSPYTDASRRILALGRLGFEQMGFTVEQDNDWKYLTYTRGHQAFASGERFLLMSSQIDALKDSVKRHVNGDGFKFRTPDDFKTAGAFYRDQVDVSNVRSIVSGQLGQAFKALPHPPSAGGPESPVESPDKPADSIDRLLEGIGFEALSYQHGAMWLRNGEVEAAKHVELTGNAKNSLMGSLVYSSPKKLMTAENGPFQIIMEAGFANPGEYMKAGMEFGLNYVAPFVSEKMGMPAMDPGAMLGLLGIGDADISKLAQEVYVMATSSTRREGGKYLPGMVVANRVEGDDLRYILVNMLDTATMMMPRDFPLVAKDFGDTTSRTWVSKDNEWPFSPTFAWTDGWLVESLWREDALAARDALASGTLLKPDKMGAANFRVRCNRQRLMRGIGDVLYEVPESEVAFGGAVTEILALLSEKDERLLMESVNTEEFTESRCKFSIGLFQKLVPALVYVAKATESEW
jgi:hypothetical protein